MCQWHHKFYNCKLKCQRQEACTLMASCCDCGNQCLWEWRRQWLAWVNRARDALVPTALILLPLLHHESSSYSCSVIKDANVTCFSFHHLLCPGMKKTKHMQCFQIYITGVSYTWCSTSIRRQRLYYRHSVSFPWSHKHFTYYHPSSIRVFLDIPSLLWNIRSTKATESWRWSYYLFRAEREGPLTHAPPPSPFYSLGG